MLEVWVLFLADSTAALALLADSGSRNVRAGIRGRRPGITWPRLGLGERGWLLETEVARPLQGAGP